MGAISQVEYDQHSANADVVGTDVKTDQAEAAVALRDIAFRQAEIDAARAALNRAVLNLGCRRIFAPSDGFIGLHIAELGQHVEPGESLMVVSRADDFSVVANFKDTQLVRIRRKQTVTMHVPMIGRDFRGHIENTPGMTGSLPGLPEQKPGYSDVSEVQGLPVRSVFDSGRIYRVYAQVCG